ncbi:3-phosphoshikimate 1-carboxyvinyltransferase [bacterium]|nr:3-phosphoshikimate 1-carboxyvinyltransferase [bacterium]
MYSAIVKPVNKLSGTIYVPGDKSISHRAVILGSLAKGTTRITGFLESEDCMRTVEIFRQLGVDIAVSGKNEVVITSKGLHGLKEPKEDLYAGNSGTTMRLMLGVLAGQKFTSRITGDDSLCKRPMRRVTDPLRKMGAKITGKVKNYDEYAPFVVSGGDLLGREHKSVLVASAQVKSAILLAGLYANEETSVIEPFKSRDHTERMLEYLGADLKVEGNKVSIKGRGHLVSKDIVIPGDISSAAFFIVATSCLKGSEIVIRNVGVNPTRTGIIDVMRRMGADIELRNEKTISGEPRADILVKSSKLKGITIEPDQIPRIIDEIPIIAVAAARARGETVIKGVSELKVKESNRLMAIHDLFHYFEMKLNDCSSKRLVIPGEQDMKPQTFSGAVCNSLGDHRIAMTGIIMGLMAKGKTEKAKIFDTDCINTSFPNFIEILKKMIPEGTIKVEK